MALSLYGKIVIMLLTFASLVLTLIVYFAPEKSRDHSSVSLITVFPSTAINLEPTDGPTIVLGVFGSCGRASNTSDFVCVSAAFPAKYDLSLLPSNIPDIILPPTFFTALFWVALLLWALGVASIYVSSVYPIERYNIKAYANLVTHVALPVGVAVWLVAYVFFLKSANDFNAIVKLEGSQSPVLFAQIGSAFTRESDFVGLRLLRWYIFHIAGSLMIFSLLSDPINIGAALLYTLVGKDY